MAMRHEGCLDTATQGEIWVVQYYSIGLAPGACTYMRRGDGNSNSLKLFRPCCGALSALRITTALHLIFVRLDAAVAAWQQVHCSAHLPWGAVHICSCLWAKSLHERCPLCRFVLDQVEANNQAYLTRHIRAASAEVHAMAQPPLGTGSSSS